LHGLATRFADYQANGDNFSCAFPEISEIIRENVLDHITESFDARFQIAHVVTKPQIITFSRLPDAVFAACTGD
jgi:hypothetical protein